MKNSVDRQNARRFASAWAQNVKVDNLDAITPRSKALSEKAFRYLEAVSINDALRESNAITEANEAKEEQARIAFAEDYNAWKAMNGE